MGGILGCRPGSLGSQWRDLPPTRPAVAVSREELQPLGDPAFQGEHNRMVFAELGLSEDEIDCYIASGALVTGLVSATATGPTP